MDAKRRCRLGVGAVASILLASAMVSAGTTGQLGGRVFDVSGEPLPGVEVSASSPSQIGGVQLAQSGADGSFLFPRLAPGAYTLTFQLDGFVTQQLEAVQIRLDRLTELRVEMPLATFAESIEVREISPIVDPEQVSTGQVFSSEYMQEAALGMDNRHYLSVATQTAGVEPGSPWGVKVLGSTQFENAYLIDGIDTTDTRDQLASFALSFEAIDEMALHTSGFEAEYGLATGGVVNLVTKSGGNDFAGTLDVRYQDSDMSSAGEHFDPDSEPFDTTDLNASFGGPILRDGLWFFTALQSGRDRRVPMGAPSTRDLEATNFLGKITWQTTPRWTLAGKAVGNSEIAANVNTSQFRAPEANADDDWRVLNAHLQLDGVVTDRLLLGLRVADQESRYELKPSNGDLSTIAHVNLVTGENYGAFGVLNDDERTRRSLDLDLAWFANGFAGSHELKGGLRYSDNGYTSGSCRTGNGTGCLPGTEGYGFVDVLDQNGDAMPLRFLVRESGARQDFDGTTDSLFLQDAWRIRPDLTLKLGVRWDRSRQHNDVGQEIADLELVQPRLGVAWDVRGNGRNVLRASWGRFMHPSSLHIAQFSRERSTPQEIWLSCSVFLSADPSECAALANEFELGYRLDPEGWEPAGWFLDPGLVFSSAPNQTDPNLDPMYAEELLVAFEREVFRRSSLELSYVDKKTRDVLEDTCNGNLPVPSADADCSHWVVTNLPQARRDYEAWLLRFETRALDRVQLVASYAYSESKGSQHGWDVTSAFDVYPYHFVNRYGYLFDHSRHRVKLNGFARLPLGLVLGIGGRWSSEFRWTPIDFNVPGMPYGVMVLEPRGSRREEGTAEVDLQLAKAFRFGRREVRVIGTVYNVFDSEQPTQVCESVSGCGDIGQGSAIEWQRPRRWEVGFRVGF